MTIEDLSGTYEEGTGELRYRTGSFSYGSAALTSNGGRQLHRFAPGSRVRRHLRVLHLCRNQQRPSRSPCRTAPPARCSGAPVATGLRNRSRHRLRIQSKTGSSVESSETPSADGRSAPPVGTTTRGAPGQDFDGSGQCYLTGPGGCGENTDVDGGCTVLTTAPFSAVDSEGNGDANVSYAPLVRQHRQQHRG